MDNNDSTFKIYGALLGLGSMLSAIKENLDFIKAYHDEHGHFPISAIKHVSLKMHDLGGGFSEVVATMGKKYEKPLRKSDHAEGMYISIYSSGFVDFVEQYSNREDSVIGSIPFNSIYRGSVAAEVWNKCLTLGVDARRLAEAIDSLSTPMAQEITWSCFALGKKFA